VLQRYNGGEVLPINNSLLCWTEGVLQMQFVVWNPWSRRSYAGIGRYLHALLVTSLLVATAQGGRPSAPKLGDIDPAGINGSLVICGGGKLPDPAVSQFLRLAGGENARLVVIPTASERADERGLDSFGTIWRERGFPTVDVLHTRDKEVANSDRFLTLLKSATAVWFTGGQQSLLVEAYVGTRVEDELYALLDRGGSIGGNSAGAAIQSRLMIAFGNPNATVMQGLDFVPGSVIDQHFKARDRLSRLTRVLADHPGFYGLGIDEDTVAIVRGRTIRVVGDSTVTVCLAASANRPARHYEVPSGRTADLTALRRAAIARAAPAFPPASPPVALVENGSLVIVGGGRLTKEMWQRFVELAGGQQARIVCVPTAAENPSFGTNGTVRALKEAGAKIVTVLHTTDRAQANRDEFIAPLKCATGVWFGGGRQWRIVDAYEGTATRQAFHDVLRRGGVIGGSSAGATIQGDYLARGNPLGNWNIIAEGYERGFAFLPGVAIDQHFTQRGRHSDMDSLMQTFPQLLGIGIDESTALVVQQSTANVMGKNAVYFFNAPVDETVRIPRITKIGAGDSYDLQQLRRTK
jgi:cyanophycinase